MTVSDGRTITVGVAVVVGVAFTDGLDDGVVDFDVAGGTRPEDPALSAEGELEVGPADVAAGDLGEGDCPLGEREARAAGGLADDESLLARTT